VAKDLCEIRAGHPYGGAKHKWGRLKSATIKKLTCYNLKTV